MLNKERLIFQHNYNCPPPPHFMIDLQQHWLINCEIGDRQCTYYLIVCALTITDCFFFVGVTFWVQSYILIVQIFEESPH